jgi:hypothetical protein
MFKQRMLVDMCDIDDVRNNEGPSTLVARVTFVVRVSRVSD